MADFFDPLPFPEPPDTFFVSLDSENLELIVRVDGTLYFFKEDAKKEIVQV